MRDAMPLNQFLTAFGLGVAFLIVFILKDNEPRGPRPRKSKLNFLFCNDCGKKLEL